MLFVGVDDTAYCIECQGDLKSENMEYSCNRLMFAHSLHHGNFEIGVTDHVFRGAKSIFHSTVYLMRFFVYL